MKRSAAGVAAILTLTVTIRGGSQDPQERPVPRVRGLLHWSSAART